MDQMTTKAEQLRMIFFIGVFVVMALWEFVAPRRKRVLARPRRWPTNLGLILANNIMLKVVLPTTAVGVAQYCSSHHIGLFNKLQVTGLPGIMLAIICLDFIIYLQHVMFHVLPVLWRLHRIHHADLDLDVTSGIRFHPIEILISAGIKFGSIYLLGVSPMAVVVFEILLNASSMFNHSNVSMSLKLDRVLRLLIVTPDTHRVHHSVHGVETNSNFAFNLSIWDRICGTYRAQPQEGHFKMTIGLPQFQSPKTARIGWVLASPFYK